MIYILYKDQLKMLLHSSHRMLTKVFINDSHRCFVVSGFGLPIVLYHSEIIEYHALTLSLSGGLLIYSAIIGYIQSCNNHRIKKYLLVVLTPQNDIGLY